MENIELKENDIDFAKKYYQTNKKLKYRIRRKDGTYLNAGSDYPSWFNLEEARKEVNREKGEQIVEHDGVNVLWEVF